MMRLKIFFIIILAAFVKIGSAQVKIRLFSNMFPEYAVFSVIEGRYEVNGFNGKTLFLSEGETGIITRYNGMLGVKTRNAEGFVCDSVTITGKTGDDSFSLRIKGKPSARRFYSGDLQCFPDLGTLVLINFCDIEKYISGVVKAEGGNGRKKEYFKTQAVITRTYMYKHFDKHLADRYNVCDNIHCQAFFGLSYDPLINSAALETQGLVILDHDSTLIMSPFHSNCGGETCSSDDVWLTGLPYLKRVTDPYCLTSGNATWEKSITLKSWLEIIMKLGYKGVTDEPSVFNFLQQKRLTDYSAGSSTVPLRTIRTEMVLRSTFFSVFANGDSIILKGRGYGHGVGLCQEGAIVMAEKGFNYKQIIDFYYSGVLISSIRNAKIFKN